MMTNTAQAEAIAVNRERENVLDDQAKRIVEGAQEKKKIWPCLMSMLTLTLNLFKPLFKKVDELAAKNGENNVPIQPLVMIMMLLQVNGMLFLQLLTMLFGPPPPQVYGAPP